MRRLALLILLLLASTFTIPLWAQSACYPATLIQTDSLRAETFRKSANGATLSPRATVVRRLASRVDSIGATCGLVPPPDTTPPPPPPPSGARRLTLTLSADTLYQTGVTWVYGKIDSAGVVLADSAALTLSNASAVAVRWGREGRRWVLSAPTVAEPLEVTLTSGGLTAVDTVLLALSGPPLPPTPTPVPPPPSADSALRRIADWRPPTSTPPYAQFDQLMRQHEPGAWARDGALWSGSNYYDRALHYYAMWIRHKDTTYKRKADAIAVNYRDNYLIANNGQATPHWSQLDGIAMHYWVNGDPESLRALGLTAWNVGSSGTWTRTGPYTDARQQARALTALLLAWQTNAPPPPNGKTWSAMLDQSLDVILPQQSADGAWRYPANTCDKSLNYMGAMLAHALGRVYDQYRPDPRIPGAIQRTVDYLWANEWLRTGSIDSFAYYEAPGCSNQHGVGGHNPTPDLTGLFAPAFGWMAKRDPAKYQPILLQLVDAANRGLYPASKQLNQWWWLWAAQAGAP